MEGVLAVQGAGAGDDPGDDLDDTLNRGAAVFRNPFGKGGALDEFDGVVEKASGYFPVDDFDEVWAVGAQTDPFL